MKSKKLGIIISIILIVISLIMIGIGNTICFCYLPRNIINNIGIGVLGSSLVTFSISFGEYRVERKRALKKYIHEADKILIELKRIVFIPDSEENRLIMYYYREKSHNKTKELFGIKDIENKAYSKLLNHYKTNNDEEYTNEQLDLMINVRYDSVCKYIENVMESYSKFAKVSLEDFEFAYDNLDFFFANKILLEKTIYNKIHKPIVDLISEIRLEAFHFDLYLDKEKSGGNFEVCYEKIKMLNSKLFNVENSTVDDFEIKTIYRSFADKIDDELQLLYQKQIDKKAEKTIEHIPVSSLTVNKMFE